MSGVVLDAGALIALERRNRETIVLISRVLERSERIAIPAPVLAQVWRDGRTQSRLDHLLASDECDVFPMDDLTARFTGELLRISGTSDVVDATVVAVARMLRAPVVTSDADDLRRIDNTLRLVKI